MLKCSLLLSFSIFHHYENDDETATGCLHLSLLCTLHNLAFAYSNCMFFVTISSFTFSISSIHRSAVSVRPTRTCWLSHRHAVQHLAIARSQWLRQERGTDCLRRSGLLRHLCLFARSWRRSFSGGALINFSSLDTHYSVNVFKLAPYSAHRRHISILTVKCPYNVFCIIVSL